MAFDACTDRGAAVMVDEDLVRDAVGEPVQRLFSSGAGTRRQAHAHLLRQIRGGLRTTDAPAEPVAQARAVLGEPAGQRASGPPSLGLGIGRAPRIAGYELILTEPVPRMTLAD